MNDAERDFRTIELPRWGRVVRSDGPSAWIVVDDRGVTIEPVRMYLRDFVARDNRVGSARSYSYVLLRWWRWLRICGVSWDRAGAAEVRDLVLWLRQAPKVRNSPRTLSAATVGTVNVVTGKRNLDDGYAIRTIRHNNAVLASFYDFWLEVGTTVLINPVVRVGNSGGRRGQGEAASPLYANHRIRYNPKLPKRLPRSLTDEQWLALFRVLRSNRDRALLSMAISTGARAGELLGIHSSDVDWGAQKVRVYRKGTGAEQWLPASVDAFVWLRLQLSDSPQPAGRRSVWTTLRRRDRGGGLQVQPLNYEALRAVLRRANVALGSNWTMHDLRHTCALRMSRDANLTLRDVQTILGHAHLSTTADIYLVEDADQVIARIAQHLQKRHDRESQPDRGSPTVVAPGYVPGDLAVLFGRDL